MTPAISLGASPGYSPAGVCVASCHSRALCVAAKSHDANFLAQYALRVRTECVGLHALAGLLTAKITLVPVPASTPSTAGSSTVADRIADAFLQQVLGMAVWRGLRNCTSVRKSVTAPAGTRSTVADNFLPICRKQTIPAVGQCSIDRRYCGQGQDFARGGHAAAAALSRGACPGARADAYGEPVI